MNLARSLLLVGPRRKKTDYGQISFSLRNLLVRAFDSHVQGFSTPLARRRSSCPPPSPNPVRIHLIERCCTLPGFPRQCPLPLACRHLPKGTKLELGRGAAGEHHPQPTTPGAASQPTGWIAKKVSWLHLSKVSPALHPPERHSLPHPYPKTRFRSERARDDIMMCYFCVPSRHERYLRALPWLKDCHVCHVIDTAESSEEGAN